MNCCCVTTCICIRALYTICKLIIGLLHNISHFYCHHESKNYADFGSSPRAWNVPHVTDTLCSTTHVNNACECLTGKMSLSVLKSMHQLITRGMESDAVKQGTALPPHLSAVLGNFYKQRWYRRYCWQSIDHYKFLQFPVLSICRQLRYLRPHRCPRFKYGQVIFYFHQYTHAKIQQQHICSETHARDWRVF